MRYFVMIFIIFVSGCASSWQPKTSGVVPLNDNKFLISRSEKGFDTTGSRVKTDAIKEANQYCATFGKSVEITKIVEQDMVPFKSDAQAEIEFRCK